MPAPPGRPAPAARPGGASPAESAPATGRAAAGVATPEATGPIRMFVAAPARGHVHGADGPSCGDVRRGPMSVRRIGRAAGGVGVPPGPRYGERRFTCHVAPARV
jgi:hypothetical protein